MAESRWRVEARRVIDEVLNTLSPNATFYQKRKAVSLAYPFGPRENHPYKVWLDEVKKAISVKKRNPKRPAWFAWTRLKSASAARGARAKSASLACRHG